MESNLLELDRETVILETALDLLNENENYNIRKITTGELNKEFFSILIKGDLEKKKIMYEAISDYIKNWKKYNNTYLSGKEIIKLIKEVKKFLETHKYLEDEEAKKYFRKIGFGKFIPDTTYKKFFKIYKHLIRLELLNTKEIVSKNLFLKKYNYKNTNEFIIINVYGKDLVVIDQEYYYNEEIFLTNIINKTASNFNKLEYLRNDVNLKEGIEVIKKTLGNKSSKLVIGNKNFLGYEKIYIVYLLLINDLIYFFFTDRGSLHFTLIKTEDNCNNAIKNFLKSERNNLEEFFFYNFNPIINIKKYTESNFQEISTAFFLKMVIIALYHHNINLKFYSNNKELVLGEKNE